MLKRTLTLAGCFLSLLSPAFASDFSDSHYYLEYGGPSGDPFAMVKSGPYVYMGGGFLDVAGDANKKNLARFNTFTETWEQVPGIDRNHRNFVRALHIDSDGTMLVGGDFTSIGPIAAQKIARFDPSTNTWSQLFDQNAGDNATGPLGGGVYSVTSLGDYVYIGGFIFNHDEAAWRFVRRFNTKTKTWSTVGTGLDDRVSTLTTDGVSKVYAGGGFRMAGTAPAQSLAVWNGLTWAEVGGGVQGDVRAIALAPNGTLYVGGQFSSAGGLPASNVAAWDGSKWDMLDGGIKGGGSVNGVYGMSIDSSGRVYISGDFDTTADGRILNKVALWDGTGSWKALGSGLGKSSSQIVNSVVAFGDEAYFGGVFADPNGSPNKKKNYARWNAGIDFSEYLHGQAGLDAGTSVAIVDGKLEVSWQSISGISYVLETSNDSLQGWQAISGSINGNNRRWSFKLDMTTAAKYYRLKASR